MRAEDFMDWVDKNGPRILRSRCWLWKGHCDQKGYGRARVVGKRDRAHRHSYRIHIGEIPIGLHVLHKCDNRPCVRPTHIFLGTQKDNVDDMLKKGRGAYRKGESNNASKLTDAAVRSIRASKQRQCDVAKIYGITQSVVSAIKRRVRWTHVL